MIFPTTEYYAPTFISILKKHNLFLYDVIPTLRTIDGKRCQRQLEIKEWLYEHNDVESFVIFDDETTELLDFVNTNLVMLNKLPVGAMLCDMKEATGLCEEHVEEAIGILNSKKFVKKLLK